MRWLHTLKNDFRFQFRYGFYYAYLFVTLLYIIVLNFLPSSIASYISVLIIFTDPSALGSFFIGAIFLFEKQQNTIEGLLVTPLRLKEYILSKVISLSVISLITSLFIAFSLNINIHYTNLTVGVILSSIFFTLLGFNIVVLSKSVNDYFMKSLITIVFMFPILDYINVYFTPLFYLLPTHASLILLEGMLKTLSMTDYLYAVGVLIGWSILAYYSLINLFNLKVILKVGDQS